MTAVLNENMVTAQVSVATTATLIAAARPGRDTIIIANVTGTQQVYIGNSASVTAATGFLLPASIGASIAVDCTSAVYGIAVTAAQTVSVLETYI
jgi:hypothetical protein